MEAVRRVSTIFTIDDSDHNRKLKGINDQYRLTQSEIRLAGQRMDAFGRNTSDLGFKQAALTKQIENLNSKTKLYQDSLQKVTVRAKENQKKLEEMKVTKDRLTKSYKDAVKTYGETSEKTKALKEEMEKANKEYLEQERVVKKNVDTANKYQTQLNKVEGELVGVQAELDKTNRDLALAEDKWKKGGEAIQRAGEKMQNVGKGMQTVGRNLSTYVTLPLVAMGTAAVNEAVKFESAFAGVLKTVDGTEQQIAGLRQGIIDMSKELPSTTQEISAVAEAAGQLGIETDSIMDFTKVIIDLGNATNIVGDEGASQLAKFANITKMSQEDFDRLGSTIVDLGNNLATTEADIVNMAMRLAGAGSQVGMSEAQILALSGALSSVGVEAEAGGSAFSKVMVNMQLAAETGGESLKDFAEVAGMSADEFAQAYKEDATGALLAFIDGLATSEERGISAIKVLDDMDIKEVRLRDSLLRAAGASEIFNDAIEIGTSAWEENIALTNEAEQRYATTESQMKITKNEIADLGRELGEELMPIVKDGLIIVKDVIQAFRDLPEETQTNIVKFGLLAAALGPVLSIGGKLVSGSGFLLKNAGGLVAKIGGAGGLTSLTSGLGGAAGTAAGGVGGLSAGLGGIVAAAAPYALAIAGIGAAGYGLYQILDQDVIPEVDLFADHVGWTSETITDEFGNMKTVIKDLSVTISEETQEQIGAYTDLSDETQAIFHELFTNTIQITSERSKDIVGNVIQMSEDIIAASEETRDESFANYEKLFADTGVLTAEEQARILSTVNGHHDERVEATEELKDEILRIYKEIRDQGGNVTQEQADRINEILLEMKENAVKAMASNEAEQNVILNRLAGSHERITADMVGDTIKELNVQKDESIRIAGETRDDLVRQAEELKLLEGGIYADKADEIIEEANRQYKETVEAAEKTKTQGIDKLDKAYGDLTDSIDKDTGEIITFWDKVKKWWNGWTPTTKNANINSKVTTTYTARQTTQGYTGTSGINYGATRPQYALGTTNALGGLSQVNEKGYELMDLPAGSKVRTHESSKQMVQDIVSETVKLFKGNSGVTVTGNQFIINNDADPEMIAEEIAFQTERKLGGVGLAYNPV